MSIDPDTQATANAGVALKDALKDSKIIVTSSLAQRAAHLVICKWVSARGYHWAVRRNAGGIYPQPDELMLGFAEAALPRIADALPDLPWEKPLGEWSKNDAITLFSVTHSIIQAVAEQTLEDPHDEIPT